MFITEKLINKYLIEQTKLSEKLQEIYNKIANLQFLEKSVKSYKSEKIIVLRKIYSNVNEVKKDLLDIGFNPFKEGTKRSIVRHREVKELATAYIYYGFSSLHSDKMSYTVEISLTIPIEEETNYTYYNSNSEIIKEIDDFIKKLDIKKSIEVNFDIVSKAFAFTRVYKDEQQRISITFDKSIITYPKELVQYVILHELVHVIVSKYPKEKPHGNFFKTMMNSVMRDWRERHSKLVFIAKDRTLN